VVSVSYTRKIKAHKKKPYSETDHYILSVEAGANLVTHFPLWVMPLE